MERRKLTKEDIDKVRNIEGFPIGTDEDIIALSDAPFYTACPNPFIEDFIKEYGIPYDEATDDYHREPFAADVSEGKTDPIYMAHTYHTKVPHKAIMQYILHYIKDHRTVVAQAEVEDVKRRKVKTPLQRVVQILKRHRDIKFADDNSGNKPISIIITTIAGRLYEEEDKLAELTKRLLQDGFDVYITADHGNTPCTGLGRLTGSGVEVETRSHKMVVLKDFANKDSLIERYGLLEYPKYYLPKDYDYLICNVGDSLDIKGENVMTHGGISLDEVVVPFIIARTEDYHG